MCTSLRLTIYASLPSSLVSFRADRISPSDLPEEAVVDLVGPQQVLQLLEPSERPVAEVVLRQVDLLEHVVKLLGASFGVPFAGEAGQKVVDLVERHAVAALVAAAWAE